MPDANEREAGFVRSAAAVGGFVYRTGYQFASHSENPAVKAGFMLWGDELPTPDTIDRYGYEATLLTEGFGAHDTALLYGHAYAAENEASSRYPGQAPEGTRLNAFTHCLTACRMKQERSIWGGFPGGVGSAERAGAMMETREQRAIDESAAKSPDGQATAAVMANAKMDRYNNQQGLECPDNQSCEECCSKTKWARLDDGRVVYGKGSGSTPTPYDEGGVDDDPSTTSGTQSHEYSKEEQDRILAEEAKKKAADEARRNAPVPVGGPGGPAVGPKLWVQGPITSGGPAVTYGDDEDLPGTPGVTTSTKGRSTSIIGTMPSFDYSRYRKWWDIEVRPPKQPDEFPGGGSQPPWPSGFGAETIMPEPQGGFDVPDFDWGIYSGWDYDVAGGRDVGGIDEARTSANWQARADLHVFAPASADTWIGDPNVEPG